MRLILCVIISLVISNIIAESSAFENFDEDDYSTKFTDMDDEYLLGILGYLDFVHLLDVAQVNNRISTLAATVYRQKYSHIPVIADNIPFSHKLEQSLNGKRINTDIIEEISRDRSYLLNETRNIDLFNPLLSKEEIHFNDCHDILNTFLHFGREIKKVETKSHRPSWQTELIGYLISQYSSNSLYDIDMGVDTQELLYHLRRGLISVERVRFGYSFPNSDARLPDLSFPELFPAVRSLHYADLYDLTYLDCHMPHLEHVIMSGWTVPIPGVIAKNPQIRIVEAYSVKSEFPAELNTLLPELEMLKLVDLKKNENEMGENVTTFEKVTTFEIATDSTNHAPNLHFPRLQNLRITGRKLNVDEYLAFLNEHNRLSRLHMQLVFLSDLQFQQVTANLDDLVELTLDVFYGRDGINGLNPTSVVEFLETHDKVMRFQAIDFPDKWTLALHEQLHNEWTAVEMSAIQKVVIFKRKRND